MRTPRDIVPYGTAAVLVLWEQKIDPDINDSVHRYAAAVLNHPAVVESVSAYCSLLVTFDEEQTSLYQLREWIYDIKLEAAKPKRKARLHRLPVVYGGDFGPDLAEVSATLGLSAKRIIQLHTKVTYRVYQLGYQPGFAFLGLTDEKIAVPRLDSPRAKVPGGSVGLAGRQTGVYPFEAPGGWQIIGRCPLEMWRNDGLPPARLQAGDEVQFFAIEAHSWEKEKSKAKWPK